MTNDHREQQTVDLEALRPVSLQEVAQGPNREWNRNAKAPELFEDWWAKHGDTNWSVKHAAREAWYACAESLGVYDDQQPPVSKPPRRRSKRQQIEEDLRASDLSAQLSGRDNIEYGHHETLPRGEHIANVRKRG